MVRREKLSKVKIVIKIIFERYMHAISMHYKIIFVDIIYEFSK